MAVIKQSANALLKVTHVQYAVEQLLNLNMETRKTEILHDINLSVYPNEILGLVGPNGSGKSTLSKILAHIIEQNQGKITLNGADYQSIQPEWHLHQLVTMVFQDVEAQFIGQNFTEDMLLYLTNFGYNETQIENAITEVTSLFGLQDLVEQPFTALSGGQKQLLAIAEALAIHPQLLILDEPTAQLDGPNTDMVIQLLQQLQREHRVTILLVTHKLAELALTDRVLVLNQGTIKQSYATKSLLTDQAVLEANQLPVPDTLAIITALKQAGLPVGQLADNSLPAFTREVARLLRRQQHA